MKLFLLFITLLGAGVKADDTATLQALNTGNNLFTARMFSEVVKENPSKSVVMSAFSVMTPLAQLAFAAEGATHDELLKTIGMPNDNVTKEVFTLINAKLKAIKGVELRMASRIYVAKNAEINDEFQAISRNVFGSDSRNIDFADNEKSAQMMNAWVEDQTNHRIKDLISADSLDASTRSVLVNAIYFKGKWKDQFRPEDTKERDFHVTKERSIKLPTMYRKGEYLYGESEELNAQLLRLPYEGDDSSMLIILPKDIEGIAALQNKLKNPAVLTKAIENMFTYDVDVYLPKFKIETTIDLKEVLENLDVKRLFSPATTQLTHLIKGDLPLYISKAIQKAFIEVNEEGAEAAAANAPFARVIIPTKFINVSSPFIFIVKTNNDDCIATGVYYGVDEVKDYSNLFLYVRDQLEFWYGEHNYIKTLHEYLKADLPVILRRVALFEKYVDPI